MESHKKDCNFSRFNTILLKLSLYFIQNLLKYYDLICCLFKTTITPKQIIVKVTNGIIGVSSPVFTAVFFSSIDVNTFSAWFATGAFSSMFGLFSGTSTGGISSTTGSHKQSLAKIVYDSRQHPQSWAPSTSL